MRSEIETTIGEIECARNKDELKSIALTLAVESDVAVFFADDENYQMLHEVYSKVAALYAAIVKKSEELQ